MKKVLVAYDSRTGKTQQMAEYIAEGVRISGNEAVVRRITEIKNEKELQGYDGYILGSPTYHLDMIGTMKTFLFMAQKAELAGKIGGAFGSYVHDGNAPKLVFNTMEFVFKMDMTDLGPFNLLEPKVYGAEGMHACQAYGKAVGEKLNG
ncbi:MAG: flavodoxin domain-containing protein [Syntrophales bacterium]